LLILFLNKWDKLQKSKSIFQKNKLHFYHIFTAKFKMMNSKIFLKNNKSQVIIEKGELISFQKDNQE
jgi:hypothetical protein